MPILELDLARSLCASVIHRSLDSCRTFLFELGALDLESFCDVFWYRSRRRQLCKLLLESCDLCLEFGNPGVGSGEFSSRV